MMEIGPYRVRKEGKLELIDGSWDEFANLLFVDNPVGTGFSYVDTNSFVHELQEMADQFVIFLEQWFSLFPHYSHDDVCVEHSIGVCSILTLPTDIHCRRIICRSTHSIRSESDARAEQKTPCRPMERTGPANRKWLDFRTGPIPSVSLLCLRTRSSRTRFRRRERNRNAAGSVYDCALQRRQRQS